MFTGIVVERGTVKQIRDRGIRELTIQAPEVARELGVGDSVAVNGVCLTATATTRRRFTVEAVPETLARSSLGDLVKGAPVNLELAARLDTRLGGHMVQGHVDGLAHCVRVQEEDGARRLWFRADPSLLRYMVAKGSVTLDGVSLTVVEVGRTTFQIALIPHTLDVTTLGSAREGSTVNVEVDVIAKYVERLTEPHQDRSIPGERR